MILLVALAVLAQEPVRYWPGEHERAVLAEYAMEHWASAGGFRVEKVEKPEQAEVRFRWVNPRRPGLYGQSYSMEQDGRKVAEIVINPSVASLGPDMANAAAKDPLFADVILFLTCVHEAGHALGPEHTRDFADIMYSFEYGGDFTGYFQRYRQRVKTLQDMKSASPLSQGDVRQIKRWMALRRQSEKR